MIFAVLRKLVPSFLHREYNPNIFLLLSAILLIPLFTLLALPSLTRAQVCGQNVSDEVIVSSDLNSEDRTASFTVTLNSPPFSNQNVNEISFYPSFNHESISSTEGLQISTDRINYEDNTESFTTTVEVDIDCEGEQGVATTSEFSFGSDNGDGDSGNDQDGDGSNNENDNNGDNDSSESGDDGDTTGLVNCGNAGPDGELQEGEMCGYEDLINLVNRIINWLIGILTLVATLLFIYAGFLYLTAGGDKNQAGNAKDIFTNVAAGFAMVLLAWLLISSLVGLFVREDWQDRWQQAVPIQISQTVDKPKLP